MHMLCAHDGVSSVRKAEVRATEMPLFSSLPAAELRRGAPVYMLCAYDGVSSVRKAAQGHSEID